VPITTPWVLISWKKITEQYCPKSSANQMVDFLVHPRILCEFVETNHKFLSNKNKYEMIKLKIKNWTVKKIALCNWTETGWFEPVSVFFLNLGLVIFFYKNQTEPKIITLVNPMFSRLLQWIDFSLNSYCHEYEVSEETRQQKKWR
jgi:hypothetical protein